MTVEKSVSGSMRRALELARSVLGATSPNPAVGAVLVKNGRLVGEGATQSPGEPHAEVMAIRDAGTSAAGATLYVTLEPCSTLGRTPPCTDAIAQAGIVEVVVATGDPDPRVDGRGIQLLRAAGLTVRAGDGAEEARRHYEAYTHHRRTARPFVILKFAASLDGKIAAASGDSRWLSGPHTRAWAHRLRPTIDAILVGVDTILLDDPQLTARPDGVSSNLPQPLRVVLDSRGRTPAGARVIQDQDIARTLIATTPAAPADWRVQMEAAGAQVLELPGEDGRVALAPLLDILGGEHGIVSLLVEGGGQVHGSFVDARLVNKVHAVIAPMIIGGGGGTAVGGVGAQRVADAVRLRDVTIEHFGEDVLVTGYPIERPPDGQVLVRPAGAADTAGYRELIGDPAQRAEREPAIEAAFDRAVGGDGGVWVAVQDGRIVGGVALSYRDAAQPEHADGGGTATLELLSVSPEWRHHGLVERLLDTAEASAAGRAFRWLTTGDTDLSGMAPCSREEWGRRGYRYYRRTEDGVTLRIKELGRGGGPP